MAGIGRKLNCAVVAPLQSGLIQNPFVKFQQFSEATVLSEAGQELHMYPIWPGQRPLTIAFDAVFLVGEGEWQDVVKEWSVLADACHRYFVKSDAVEQFITILFRPTVLAPEDCVNWKQRLIEDYQAFSKKLLTFFQIFDSDNSGSFTVNTFSSKMTDIVDEMGSNVLQHLYEDIDRQRDFKIDFEELENWWRKGRKGKSRELINAAVVKFLPWEIDLRDLSFEEHFSTLHILTEDNLPKPVSIELRGQLGLSDELIPHMKNAQSQVWGFLFPVADLQDATAEALKAGGLTESRTEQTVAFFHPLSEIKQSQWSHFHFALKSAIDAPTLPQTSILRALFSSFTFSSYSNALGGSLISSRRTSTSAVRARDIEQKRRGVPQELIFFWDVLTSVGPNLPVELVPLLTELSDDRVAVFWANTSCSAVLKVEAKGWKRVVSSA